MTPGSDLTFFEYPGRAARPRRRRDGAPASVWRLGSGEALDFWEQRLEENDTEAERGGDGVLRFADPEGLGHALKVVVDDADEPLIADHPEVPAELALQGFDGAIAYASNPEASRPLLEEASASSPEGEEGQRGWECRGDSRGGLWG